MTGLLIVRSARDSFRLLWVSLTFITHIQTRRVKISVIHVSGTIKACEKKALTMITNWIAQSRNRVEHIRRELQAKEMVLEIDSVNP